VVQHFRSGLHARSAALLQSIETQFDRIIQGWILVAGIACALRIASARVPSGFSSLTLIAPYLLLILAPVASALLSLRWFADGDAIPRNASRLRWPRTRAVTLVEARRHQLFGTGGIMVSLLVGIMLNVPVRAAEYLASNPPIPVGGPHWLSMLHVLMTFDVVLFSSLYMVAFVAGLRRTPWFPALLIGIWAADLSMQMIIAIVFGRMADLPPAVGQALAGLIDGNVKKTLISVAVWLPYLIVSTRVNVTFRHRLPA
jgi:hypothetical protein